jgi:hypothetical protein
VLALCALVAFCCYQIFGLLRQRQKDRENREKNGTNGPADVVGEEGNAHSNEPIVQPNIGWNLINNTQAGETGRLVK